MSEKIIVMGGSFNPPTVAHQELMLAAVNALGADRGIFVPSSHDYVKKKMSKTDQPSEILDQDIRRLMLCAMADDDPRLSVDAYEYSLTVKSRTFDTLLYLQEKYPDAELYFLAGGDKIDIFPRWYKINDFLERFHIIVTNREDYDAGAAIDNNKYLSLYRDRFVVIDYPAGIGHISSTAVREMWREGDYAGAKEMLHPGVYGIMAAPTRYVIGQFRGDYYFLSNFYEASITYDGLTYKNAEAAFQAQKCLTEEEKRGFSELSPAAAKSRGRRVALRPDWEEVKVGLMEEIVYAKFIQNEDLKQMLLATGNALLKEGNVWNDLFWGVSLKSGRGKNTLGNILMRIRDNFRQEQKA